MDQTKIGSFLKELRQEKKLSQEQLAEQFNVSSRSISRWENGNTMPDISIIIELADFYEVDIRELLNGERKSESMEKDLKETLELVADYTNSEKEKMTGELVGILAASAAFFCIVEIIIAFNLTGKNSAFESFAIFCTTIGLVYSVMGITKLMQINGQINKEYHKKIIKRLLIAGGILLLFSIFAILWAIGMFG